MRATPSLLFLCTEVHARGGIQRFNRTLLAAAAALGIRTRVLSIHDALDQGDGVDGQRGDRLRWLRKACMALLWGNHSTVLIGHVHFLTVAILTLLLRPGRRPRVVLVAHGVEVWTGLRGLRGWAACRLDLVLCVSAYTRDQILRQAPELPPQRLTLFPNALDDSWTSQPMRVEHTDPPSPFFLSVARLTSADRTKGLYTVLEAFSNLADRSLRYVIAGDGDDVDTLRATARRLGIESRVEFAGPVGDARLRSLYESCRAFVLPSGQEGFGIVFLEAMHFGAPVIAARSKGAIDVITHEQTGLLVDYGDVVGLRETLERVAGDELLRRRLTLAARTLVAQDGPFAHRAFTSRLACALAPSPR